jgi:hypothetical protein
VTITAEQAKAELARRAGAGATPAPAGGITPEQAKAELARREADKDYGPLGLGDNFARMGQTLDDSARIIADSATRGVADKAMGPEQQAATEAARERQENWIPGIEDLQRIGTAGITGAGLGGLGAKLGDAFGVNTSRGKDQPYPTDQALQQASEEAKRLAPGGPRAADLEDRVSRLGEVRNAETTGRDAFANLRAGTPEEAAARDAISGAPKPAVTQAAEFVDKYGKAVPPAQTIVLEALLSGGIPYKTAMAYAAKIGLSKIGKAADMPDAKQTEFLASLVRDPRGIGNTGTDQATIDFWRDRLSKLAVGAGKEF